MRNYLKVKTTDNTQVWLNPEQIAAIEEIPGTARTNPYLKLYVAGYSFNVEMATDEFFNSWQTATQEETR